MPKFRTWEEECLPRLRVIGPGRPVALCVLWNLIEKLPEYVPGIEAVPGLAVIGNLRTPIGIGWFLRGLWQFPSVRRVVVWGSDLTGTGEALLKLWQEGPTVDHRVPGFGWRIDPLVPVEAIGMLRDAVELVDLRSERSAASIVPAFTGVAPGSRREVRDFPPVAIPDRAVLPSVPATIFIRGEDPGDAWQRILHHIVQYGRPRDTRKQESIIHCFDVHAVFPVPVEDDPEQWFGMNRSDAERYLADVLRSTPPTTEDAEGREVSTVDYHYGQRMQDWLGHNQLAEVTRRLRENPETKRASISILQAADLETLEDAPCWVLITFAIIDGNLTSSHVFRSHDMYGGWPNNALAVLRLHRQIAAELGVGLGWAEVVSQNAQIYLRHLPAVEDWLAHRGFRFAQAGSHTRFRPDPAGSFAFSIIGERAGERQVRAQLLSPSGDEVLWELESPNPSLLIRWIVASMVLEPQHVRYLGGEEEKLMRAFRTGELYHQG